MADGTSEEIEPSKGRRQSHGNAEKGIKPRRTSERYGSNSKEGSSPNVSLKQAGRPVDRSVTSNPSNLASNSTTSSQSDEIASFSTDKGAGKASKFQIKPFRRMVRQLEKYLDTAKVTELAQLTEQTDMVLEMKELQRPFHHLMAIWEKKGIVTETGVDTLVELLEELEIYEALNLVKSYQELLSEGSTEVTLTVCSMPTETTQSIEVPNQRQRKSYVQSDGELRTSLRASEVLTTPSRESRQVTHTREDYVLTVLQLLGIGQQEGKRLTILDSMTLDRIHLFEDTISPVNVVMGFLTRLISYDYRSIRLFKELEEPNLILSAVPSQHSKRNPSSFGSTYTVRLSCRDSVYAILMHCDPFLKQELLSKMSACQLAVPIILPDLSQNSLSFLLWGIQKISKAWQDPASSVVYEVNVTQHSFPVVAAVRFSNPAWSKSNTLNKILGSVQGNDEHPYFCSQEQDVAPSILSKGTLEAVWYLPSGRKSRKHTLETPVCFLNLRGDALDLPAQVQFLCNCATVTLVFVNKRDVRKILRQLNEITLKSKVLLILSSNGTSVSSCKEDEYLIASIKQTSANVVDTSTLASVDVSEKICYQIKGLLKEGKPFSINLDSAVSVCEKIGIAVDTLHPWCSKAREAAVKILQSCKENPKLYKLKALPLQAKWQKWSELDKDRSWKGAQGNLERELARLNTAKNNQRQRQREIGMSTKMRFLYEELLHTSAEYKQFLVFWLEHYLNEVSLASLRPLLDDMKTTRDELRDTAAKITDMQRRLNVSFIPIQQQKSLQANVKQLKSKESKLQIHLTEKTKTFDASSLGFEHFVREFGQIYECFYNTAQRNQRNARQPFDVKLLPQMAAEMLLSGHPMEIFDGDEFHVPIKWVQGVLRAVQEKIGDASVYVISVIGIQSSGKSTLLNSMFGVRFAVSAGRCTRGVFMQLLPLSDNLRKEIGCEYIAVIDTEGLKAPEKAIVEQKSEDNELATFALCLSDMTLINIGGQTVGEDLTNILQISAHAFIRMKEVHLSSSCYLIQQFVADITAQYRNQSSTQSILQKLDQAVVTAAAEERKEDQYRQFSDCFNIVNVDNKDDNVQYIPSLWRGSMSSPNHVYSETVLKLKSALLREIKESTRSFKLSDFEKRVSSVWNAVKQEDFVFNFRNSVEIAQYNKFTQIFKKQQLRLTQGMLKWELEAKQQIRNTTVENIEARKAALLQELEQTLALEMEEVRTATDETMQSREFEIVKQHSTYFYRDLELVGKNILDTVKKMIRAETNVITNAKAKEYQILPKLKANLRKQVLPVAERLKNEFRADYADLCKDEICKQTEEDV
ncbi:interferon-induced very large GTPase 1-like isoform X2 [Apostichopus japonicus]|uniref:interferon-induced very large GTPase 1-like isoform X2 n=1 Tax=Stichopus japonicus TaxID=307972 RepID=UPI003AB7207F